ncbi:hypothetical protein [Streptomyces sp. NPDC002057]|uniref:hypothetical protein n=1 Tax=Streptomyces sp. NPDC002057 TaxID=3154664 RepID=UPI00332D6037
MDHDLTFDGDAQTPEDVVYDSFFVSYREFWLVAAGGPDPDLTEAIPEENSIAGGGESVGIPTLRDGVVRVTLSSWENPAPDARGTFLGQSLITAPEREITLRNVEGKEPGSVLVLESEGDYHVKVWRSGDGSGDDLEEYDIRVWPYPAS